MKNVLTYFPELSKMQIDRLNKFQKMIVQCNNNLNLISRKDIQNIEERHILHSLAIAKFIHWNDNTKVIDFGTGGGLPGIPLAIFCPKVEFLLVDSIGKKIEAVSQMIKHLKLKNVNCLKSRIEDLEEDCHFVICRALTAFSKIVYWAKPKIKPEKTNDYYNGIICLKGGDLSNELKLFPESKTICISNFFREDFFREKKIVYLPVHSSI